MHLAPAEPGSEKLLAESREEAFRCVKRRLYAISNSSHCVGGHHRAPGGRRVPASHFPATGTSQSPPAPLPPRPYKTKGKQFYCGPVSKKLDANRFSSESETRKEEENTGRASPWRGGERGGDTGTSEINLTGKGRKVR